MAATATINLMTPGGYRLQVATPSSTFVLEGIQAFELEALATRPTYTAKADSVDGGISVGHGVYTFCLSAGPAYSAFSIPSDEFRPVLAEAIAGVMAEAL